MIDGTLDYIVGVILIIIKILYYFFYFFQIPAMPYGGCEAFFCICTCNHITDMWIAWQNYSM